MRTKGISTFDPEKYPHEYYTLAVVSKATGLSPTHLRKSLLPKYRFGNTIFLKVSQVNHYIEGACQLPDSPKGPIKQKLAELSVA